MRSATVKHHLRYVGVALAATISSSLSIPINAHVPNVSGFGAGTATVDGVISPGEWDNAGQINFQAKLPLLSGGGTTPATVYVMNDADNLYLAVRVQRAALDVSTVAFEFDNDHDGVREAGDDAIHVNGHPILPSAFFDSFRGPCPGGPPDFLGCAWNDTQSGGSNDGQGAAANDGTFSVYELSHPLNSPDDDHDVALGPGSVVGFVVQVRFIIGGFPDGFGDTSYPTDFVLQAEQFGDIVITPIPSTIDIKPGNAQNKIKLSSLGVIPVAILSTTTFSAPTEIAPGTLTFGRTGNEASLSHFSVADVNQDGLIDLIAHFYTQLAAFQFGDTVGILKGQRTSGAPFVGTDSVQILN